MTVGRILEKSLYMIYYDQRGSGRSASPSNSDYSLARMSKDMEEIRNYLRIRKWNIMGHSFAGLLITDYATRYPGSLLSLISVNTTINLNSSMQSHLDFGMKELGLTDSVYTDNKIPLEQRVWKVHEKLTEKNIWYKLMFRNAYEKSYSDSITLSIPKFNHDFANHVWNLPEYAVDKSAQTKQITVPVLIFTGDADYAIGPDHFKRFLFPNKRIVHYIGGHAPFQEEPQWFSEKVLDFIKHKS
jgi:proline iminopeptidase